MSGLRKVETEGHDLQGQKHIFYVCDQSWWEYKDNILISKYLSISVWGISRVGEGVYQF